MARISNAMRYVKYGKTQRAVERQLVSINLFGKKVKVHDKVYAKFYAWDKRVRDYEKRHHLKPYIPKVVQTYNWRLMRGSKSRSLHSWGIAVDIDPQLNPVGGSHDHIPNYVIEVAEAVGFTWGGRWKMRDLMHFEWRS